MLTGPMVWMTPKCQLSAHQPAHPRHGVSSGLGRRDGFVCRREQGSAGFGQLDPAGAAHEQVGAEFALERAIELERLDCVRCARVAARVKWRSSATARKWAS